MTIYLYKKTHNITGLQYLGKTSSLDPYKYRGSGLIWSGHLAKHGTDVTTEILRECKNDAEVKYWGLYYSELWNIVDSPKWANLKPESGDGGSSVLPDNHVDKIKSTCLEKYGVDNVSKVELIKNKKKIKAIKNYNVDNVSQSDIIKKKKEDSALKRYGVKNVSQSDEVKRKKEETRLAKINRAEVKAIQSYLLENNLSPRDIGLSPYYARQNNTPTLQSIIEERGIRI